MVGTTRSLIWEKGARLAGGDAYAATCCHVAWFLPCPNVPKIATSSFAIHSLTNLPPKSKRWANDVHGNNFMDTHDI
jgi:hypothetical protein